MTKTPNAVLGQLIRSFFTDYLPAVKGLRESSIRSYRDTIRLLLIFTAGDKRVKVTKLTITDLTFERVQKFLRYLEDDRHNHVRTRNQRLAAIHTLFEYIATREPEILGTCQQVAAIPSKRSTPPETHFLERDEIEKLLASLPTAGKLSLRDRTLLLFLYNTGARVQEIADLTVGQLDLNGTSLVRLHGKGDKWRTSPLWKQTANLLGEYIQTQGPNPDSNAPVFTSQTGRPLTRSGIYKIVRRHAAHLDNTQTGRRVTPHLFRHTAAMHMLEAGVEINVIRGWLGHADITTTTRYAEINTKAKIAALRTTETMITTEESHQKPEWRTDKDLLHWLTTL